MRPSLYEVMASAAKSFTVWVARLGSAFGTSAVLALVSFASFGGSMYVGMACLGGADDAALDGGGRFAVVGVALVWLADDGNATKGTGFVGNGAEIADLLSTFSGVRGGLFAGAGLVGASTLADAGCGAVALAG